MRTVVGAQANIIEAVIVEAGKTFGTRLILPDPFAEAIPDLLLALRVRQWFPAGSRRACLCRSDRKIVGVRPLRASSIRSDAVVRAVPQVVVLLTLDFA